ncbi:hypothetical protein ACJX0J_019025, partial [Zea mays]
HIIYDDISKYIIGMNSQLNIPLKDEGGLMVVVGGDGDLFSLLIGTFRWLGFHIWIYPILFMSSIMINIAYIHGIHRGYNSLLNSFTIQRNQILKQFAKGIDYDLFMIGQESGERKALLYKRIWKKYKQNISNHEMGTLFFGACCPIICLNDGHIKTKDEASPSTFRKCDILLNNIWKKLFHLRKHSFDHIPFDG